MVSATNSHRLLLFYSVECGLKAVFLKRNDYDRTEHWQELRSIQHDINKLLDELRVPSLKLPDKVTMDALETEGDDREVKNREINQMWRYGGRCKQIEDSELETKLLDILEWIEQELERL